MIIFPADWDDFAVVWLADNGAARSTLLICHFGRVAAPKQSRGAALRHSELLVAELDGSRREAKPTFQSSP
jgi:hypothetical protein